MSGQVPSFRIQYMNWMKGFIWCCVPKVEEAPKFISSFASRDPNLDKAWCSVRSIRDVSNKHQLNQLKQSWGFIRWVFGIPHRNNQGLKKGRDDSGHQDKNQMLRLNQDCALTASMMAAFFFLIVDYASLCSRKPYH